ncbi:MAG: DUF1080 domain-containing protein [Verrucomicrobiota bacterium]|nr:DUF1080 domain-containing protein [Verrucomicrobiota bacterium]
MLRSLFAFHLALLTTLAVFADTNKLTPEEQAAGWKLLFDGKTTDGWRKIGKDEPPGQSWVVEDGTLKLKKGLLKTGGGDIVTAAQFSDFEFSFEWKIAPGGNSGVKYNLPDPKKGVGCEYQLLDDAKHPDGKAHSRQTGGLYDVLPPAADKKLHPPGEWNQSRIIVTGTKVEHWLNGVKSVEFEFGSDALKAAIAGSKFKNAAGWGVKTKSPILLQDHGNEVAFRNMKIRAGASDQ